ncbi:MAG: hypothetical protein ACTHMV_14315 [Chitinophagaceae bacterium]
MSTQKNRIDTIIAIINSNVALSSGNINKLKGEFRQVLEVDVISPARRKNLLKVLHSTRALDSTLRAVLDHHGIRNSSHSIGKYLTQLATHNSSSLGRLTQSERHKYQNTVANIRNLHLHSADSYPKNDSEVNDLISEMQALMTRVAGL